MGVVTVQGADIVIMDVDGKTALHWTANNTEDTAVKTLLVYKSYITSFPSSLSVSYLCSPPFHSSSSPSSGVFAQHVVGECHILSLFSSLPKIDFLSSTSAVLIVSY